MLALYTQLIIRIRINHTTPQLCHKTSIQPGQQAMLCSQVIIISTIDNNGNNAAAQHCTDKAKTHHPRHHVLGVCAQRPAHQRLRNLKVFLPDLKHRPRLQQRSRDLHQRLRHTNTQQTPATTCSAKIFATQCCLTFSSTKLANYNTCI